VQIRCKFIHNVSVLFVASARVCRASSHKFHISSCKSRFISASYCPVPRPRKTTGAAITLYILRVFVWI